MSRRLDWTRDGAGWPNRAASRFVEAGGVRFHVQVAGDGPALLLLHGTGGASHSWRGLWPLLAPRFRLIAPDLPGHGFSQALPRPTIDAMARSVAALVRALDARPAAIIGHSAGAAIALSLVTDDPDPEIAVVGIGAALRPLSPAQQLLVPGIAGLMRLNPFLVPGFTLAASLPGRTRRFLERATGSAIDAEGARLYGLLFGCPGHVEAALAMMASWDLVPLARRLPSIANPVLLVHGRRDRAIAPEVTTEAARRLARGRAVLLDALGHLAHEEAPAIVGEAIAPALDRAIKTESAQ